MKRILRDNGLSICLGGLFLAFWIAQSAAGLAEYNEDRAEHGRAAIDYGSYLTSGHFIEATFENWESEFLQMGMYVYLTVVLFQRGSSESKGVGAREAVDEDPRSHANDPSAPWPVRRGGFVLRLYEHSLGLAFVFLFLVSFAGHAIGGAMEHREEMIEHGREATSFLDYVGGPSFWFESFQNWQSEFLAVFSIVVLSIFLRQRGSPESKPVAASHRETGS
jgi:hypothetical protein